MPKKDMVIESGKNIIRKISHGGNIDMATERLAEIIGEANAAGYSFKQSIQINQSECLIIFDRRETNYTPKLGAS